MTYIDAPLLPLLNNVRAEEGFVTHAQERFARPPNHVAPAQGKYVAPVQDRSVAPAQEQCLRHVTQEALVICVTRH